MKLQFLGANRQVTGSCYLLDAAGLRIMIDCGLFQERQFLERNWQTFPVPPRSIDVMLLTHAHLDHVGRIPKLVREGFSAKIITTRPSVDLSRLVMLDSAHIQEEDAAFKHKRHQREGRPDPRPIVPLYTIEDAQRALPLLTGIDYDQPVKLNDSITARFIDAGHILGSASIELTIIEHGSTKKLVFSGDVGNPGKPLIGDPTMPSQADYVIMESTYGDRDHKSEGDVANALARIIANTVARGGNLVIPTFVIERAQELTYYLAQLVRQKRIPRLAVFLDSPMAADVTQIFERYPRYLDEATHALIAAGQHPLQFANLHLTRTVEASKAINAIRGTCIIMAGSGMATGGRVKHHLLHNLARPESTVLFVGYQAEGTLGRQITEGTKQVRVAGEQVTVRAKIQQLHGLSAHADRTGLLHWAAACGKPRRMFLTHGEEKVALGLAEEIKRLYGWDLTVPKYLETVEL